MTIEEDNKQYLNAMGIDIWLERNTEKTSAEHNLGIETNNWQQLQQIISQCQKCGLCSSRTQTVFGTGSPTADLMIIGEAPGANEDQQGKPFVGRAGELLTEMLKSVGIAREDVFIANILKCRPPNNRDPSAKEVATCTPYLKQQIEMIKPKLIVAVGRIAAQFLLDSKTSLGKLRTEKHTYQGTPLLVTYHPAYLLRKPSEKRKSFLDMISIKQRLLNPNIS